MLKFIIIFLGLRINVRLSLKTKDDKQFLDALEKEGLSKDTTDFVTLWEKDIPMLFFFEAEGWPNEVPTKNGKPQGFFRIRRSIAERSGRGTMHFFGEATKDSQFWNWGTPEFHFRTDLSQQLISYFLYKQKEARTTNRTYQREDTPATREEKPELMKTKIADLTLREKLQRYLRKPTRPVMKAIIKEFNTLDTGKQEKVVGALDHLNEEHIVALRDTLAHDLKEEMSEDTKAFDNLDF